MDPLALLLLLLFLGLPFLSFVVLFAFAATADYAPRGIDVRGGSLRGALATAIAKILVGDVRTFQLPLVVELEKTGLIGAATPLFGGATVRDIEWRIYADGEHVSTVTEASSVRVGGRQRILHLPVNAEVHLPRGLLGTYRKYRQDRRQAHEVQIEVRGHVLVKHWFMTREMPVRVTRHVVLGDPVPVVRVAWDPEGPEPAARGLLRVEVHDPYRSEPLDGTLRVALVAPRRLRPDAVHAAAAVPVRLGPGATARHAWHVAPDPGGPVGAAGVVALEPRLWWDDRPLAVAAPAAPAGPDEPAPVPVEVRLAVPVVDGTPTRLGLTAVATGDPAGTAPRWATLR